MHLCGRARRVHPQGDLATYWVKAINFDLNKLAIYLKQRENHIPRKQAALCVLYLKDAGHKMANTVLSRFYALAIRKEQNADSEFFLPVKQSQHFHALAISVNEHRT